MIKKEEFSKRSTISCQISRYRAQAEQCQIHGERADARVLFMRRAAADYALACNEAKQQKAEANAALGLAAAAGA